MFSVVARSKGLWSERHLIIDCVERVLRQFLCCFDLTVPGASASVRLTSCEGKHLRNRQTQRASERAADILEGGRSNRLVDLGQVDRDTGHRRRRVDLVAAQGRIAEIHVQGRGQHLGLQHGIHRRATGVRRVDDSGDVSCDLRARGSRAQILERRVLSEPGSGFAHSAYRSATSNDGLTILVLPETYCQRASSSWTADLNRLAGTLTGLNNGGCIW